MVWVAVVQGSTLCKALCKVTKGQAGLKIIFEY